MATELEQITGLLQELDKELHFNQPASLYLIGGGGITLAYDHQNRTADLDFIDPPAMIIKKAGEGTRLAKKYGIYISPVYEINFSAPNDWKDKCQLLDLSLKNLKIWVASVEDIILGKLARMEPKDLEDIFSLHVLRRLDARKLLKRLNENTNELRKLEYRHNAKLLFKEVFSLSLTLTKGRAVI